MRAGLLAVFAALGCARPAPPAAAPTSSAGGDARADQAALYALPLVIMDLTREQFFADPVAADATPNRFLHIPILANPSFRSVVRPNVDTLYSTAWLDLSDEPVLLTLPPDDGRYFLVQCMDAWTNVFAAPGIRTLGNRGATYAIVGPHWHGELPPLIEVLRSPTPMVWVLGRVHVRDPDDLPAARAFQQRLDLRPASRASDTAYHAALPHPRDPNVRRPIMRDLLRDLGPAAFFERFARLAAANPPSPRDPEIVRDVLAPLGLAPARSAPMTWSALDDATRSALAGGLDRVLTRLADPAERRRHSAVTPAGWSSLAPGLGQGNYGVNYEARAAVAMIGLGANLRIDAIYMNASVDATGQPLDGSRHYRLRFAAGAAPPVHAFWSVTLYDEQGYLVENPAARYAIKSGDPLVAEPDGALVIDLGPDDPDPERRAGWLPTPAHQRFELSLRAYWPDDALLQDRWSPPAVTPVP
jgi:hypothetical protein